MNISSWKKMSLISVIVSALLLIAVLTGCDGSALNNKSNQPEYGQNTSIQSGVPSSSQVSKGAIRFSDLPIEARKTMLLIKSGGPFPYPQDGSVFNNFEGLLPKKPSGYYHEFTVPTPGSPDRGARRIVVGGNGEYYYTDDHYSTFKLIVE